MDEAYNDTEKKLKELEKRIKREYAQASREVQYKLDAYMADFYRKDEEMRGLWEAGKITKKEYTDWRYGQLMVGKRWGEMQYQLAQDYENADIVARGMIYGYLPEIYALNFNYGVYLSEGSGVYDTGFTLYSRHTVEYLMTKDPQLLPIPSPKRLEELTAKGLLWNMNKVNSVMLQGVLQGESIPKIAKRLAYTVGESNYHAAVRNARTMTTAAQNGGRDAAFERAQSMGIDTVRTWVATLDGRTRHDHRMADGQQRKVGEPFDVGGYKMMRPADPEAPAHLVYNCRCCIVGEPKGLVSESRKGSVTTGEFQSYEEWQQGHASYERRKKKVEE